MCCRPHFVCSAVILNAHDAGHPAWRCHDAVNAQLSTERIGRTFRNADQALATLCECEISNSLMLHDERFVIAHPIMAITDLPRVRPRKLTKLASLSLREALSLSHRNAYRDSPDKGGHNVQIAYRNRFSARLDLSLRDRADRRRCNRSRDTMVRHGAQR